MSLDGQIIQSARGITLDIFDVKGKFRYEGLAREVFHNHKV
jgi:hypothetical protein